MDTNTSSTHDFAEDSSRDDDDPVSALSSPYQSEESPAEDFRRRIGKGGIRRILRFFFSPSDLDCRGVWSHAPQAETGSLTGSLMSEEGYHRPHATTGPLQEMLFSSWLNGLLIFVPIGVGTYLARMSPIAIFTSNVIAVIPLSSLLTAATEKVARDAGETVGALLNISLGNLVELILFVALANDQIRIVQASILGSILVNSLLILGSALLATGLSDNEPVYNTAETQLLSCLLFTSVFVFLMPTAFGYTFDQADGASDATLKMTRASALMVLLIYTLYFVHELKTHPIRGDPSRVLNVESPRGPTTATEFQQLLSSRTSNPIILPPRIIRFADEDQESPAQGTASKAHSPIVLGRIDTAASEPNDGGELESRGRSSDDITCANRRPNSYLSLSRSRMHSRSLSLDSSRASSVSGRSAPGLMRSGLTALQIMRDSRTSLDSGGSRPPPPGKPSSDLMISVLVLVITSGLMSVNAEFLVVTIDDVTHQGHLSESVIGLIILPIVGNVAEYVTVVTVAVRDKLDLAIAVAVGSSIQIALCVTPLTVIAGWILSRDLSLTFSVFETATLVGTALLVGLLVSSDGDSKLRTCGLKGALMCACYVIIGLGAYLSPSTKSGG